MLYQKLFDPANADTDGIAADLPVSGTDDDGIAVLTEDGTEYDSETEGWDETEVDEGVPRRIIVTTTGNDDGKTITLVGTDADGEPYSETIAMANVGVTRTAQRFATVTSATTSAEPADEFDIGWEISWWDEDTGAEWIRNDVPDALAHQLCVVSGHNSDENKVITLHGFDADGNPIADTATLGTATAVTETSKYFSRLSHVTASAALVGVLDIGWVDELVSATIYLDWRRHNADAHVFWDETGTLEADLQLTVADPGRFTEQELVPWTLAIVAGLDDVQDGEYWAIPAGVVAARLKWNSYSNGADATLYISQPEI